MINLESVLCALIKNKSSKAINVMQVQKAQKVLEAMESTMKEIEEGLESVFRYLLKSVPSQHSPPLKSMSRDIF